MKNGKLVPVGAKGLSDDEVDEYVSSLASVAKRLLATGDAYFAKKASAVDVAVALKISNGFCTIAQTASNISRQTHRPNRGSSSKSKTIEMVMSQPLISQD